MTTKPATHTPGPWDIVTVNAGDSKVSRTALGIVGPKQGGHSVIVCRMPAEYSPTHAVWATAEANARLIAAAPELLEALESLVQAAELLASAAAARFPKSIRNRDTFTLNLTRASAGNARAALLKARGEA